MGLARMAAEMLSCGSNQPMQWPDGNFLPALTFQSRQRIQLAVGDASVGGRAMIIQPDDIQNNILYGTIALGGTVAWDSAWSNSSDHTLIENNSTQYRTLAVRVCGKYIGSTADDQGLVYVKSGLVDPYIDAIGIPNDAYLNATYSLLPVDYVGPIREGFELVSQPADPTSRKYRSTTYVNTGFIADEDTRTALRQLQTADADRWPFIVVMAFGAQPSSSPLEVEIVVDYELSPSAQTLAVQAARVSPPDNPALRSALGNAYRALEQAGSNVASRAVVTASGGLTNFLENAISGVAGGARRFASHAAYGALTGAAQLMMARLSGSPIRDVVRPSLRITEL